MASREKNIEGVFVRLISNYKRLKRHTVYYFLNNEEFFIGYL